MPDPRADDAKTLERLVEQNFKHIPVLLNPVLEWLRPSEGGRIVDVTLGGGGHSRALADRLGPTGLLVGLDQDPDALAAGAAALEGAPCVTKQVRSNFRHLDEALTSVGLVPWSPELPGSGIDGLLADLGVSSHQLDKGHRGFSFQHDGPLDMRMSPDGPTAAELIADADLDTLARWLKEWGDVRRAYRVAKAIKRASDEGSLTDTLALRRVCERATPGKWGRIHPATTVFQAIRIAVNDEFGALDALLEDFVKWLRPGGRGAFISFHSGEDRRVKNALRALEGVCTCPPRFPVCVCEFECFGRSMTRKPVVATETEREENPRARSAKLRVFERRD